MESLTFFGDSIEYFGTYRVRRGNLRSFHFGVTMEFPLCEKRSSLAIPYAVGSTHCIEVFAQHQPPGIQEPQSLLELHRAKRLLRSNAIFLILSLPSHPYTSL